MFFNYDVQTWCFITNSKAGFFSASLSFRLFSECRWSEWQSCRGSFSKQWKQFIFVMFSPQTIHICHVFSTDNTLAQIFSTRNVLFLQQNVQVSWRKNSPHGKIILPCDKYEACENIWKKWPGLPPRATADNEEMESGKAWHSTNSYHSTVCFLFLFFSFSCFFFFYFFASTSRHFIILQFVLLLLLFLFPVFSSCF